MSIVQILGILTFLSFFGLMFTARKSVDKNRLFIQYILLAFPFVSIYVIPGALGLNSFHITTYIFAVMFYRKKQNDPIPFGKFYRFLFVTITIVGIIGCYNAATLSPDTTRAWIEYFATFIFAKILVDECIADPMFFFEIVKWLRITVLFAIAFIAVQFVLGVDFAISKVNPNVLQEGATRYPSFFQDPQKCAQFLAAGSFLFLIKDWGEEKIATKNYIFLVITLIALLYTGGRGGLGGFALGFSLIVIFGNAMYKIYALLIGAVMFVVIYNFSDKFAVFNRTDNVQDSYDFRFSIWKDAYQIFLDNPLFGIAPGNYANYVSVHNPDQFWFIDNEFVYYDHPESGYLKLLTEYGAVGFIAIILFIVVPMIISVLTYLRVRDTTFILLVSSLMAWMLGFYTVYSLGDIRIQIFVVTFICLLITNYRRFETDEEPETLLEQLETEEAHAG